MARTSSGKPAYQGASRSYDEIKSIRVPVIGAPVAPSGLPSGYDQRFLNGFFEIIKNPETGKAHTWFTKRKGYGNTASANFQASGGAVRGRGLQYWNGYIFTVYADQIYRTNVTTHVTNNLGVTLTTNTGKCGFATTRAGAGTQYLGINDGAKLYLIDVTFVVTTITVNFPNPNTRDLIYMDGYWFTMKASDASVHQCDLDDPTTWNSAKFLTAQQYEGPGVGLAHQNNILIAFQDKSIAMFYDGGNSAGSVLTLYEQAVQQIGCVAQASIVSDERFVMWVGNANNGGFTVYQLDGVGGLKLVSTPTIERIINDGITNGGVAACNAFSIRVSGKFFYVLQLGLPTDVGFASRTLVYDYVESLWTEWTNETNPQGQWPIYDVAAADASQASSTIWVQHFNDGWVYTIGGYNDPLGNYQFRWQTVPLDFDTMLRKYYKSIEIVCDQSTGDLVVYYTNWDNSLSGSRTLDASSNHLIATNLGNARRRSWGISLTNDQAFRIEAMEFKIRLGQS